MKIQNYQADKFSGYRNNCLQHNKATKKSCLGNS